MSQQKSSFLDSKTILAIALTTVLWVGWQAYLQKKYPQPAATPQSEAAKVVAPSAAPEPESQPAPKNDELASPAIGENETDLPIDDKVWSFKLSSRGMAIKDLELKGYTDRAGRPIRIGAEANGHLPLETNLMGHTGALSFSISKISAIRYVGRARVDGLEIVKTVNLDSAHYRIDTQILVSGQGDSFSGLTTFLVEPLSSEGSGGIFAAPAQPQDAYVHGADKTERHYFAGDSDQSISQSRVLLTALGSQYFTQALVNRSDVMPDVKAQASVSDRSILATVSFPTLNKARDMVVEFSAFLGPKDLSVLKEVDENLAGLVDFGFFSVLGRPILRMLRWFHNVVGNWGLAIILLTILVRFLVLPFNVMSFRSMKAMQQVNPQIQALKEKHKEDKARLNQEMMALFKTNRVNPLGGCLPVALQIPIFFALYQVLGHSIELYQAPFMFWIHDLSHRDPYFVLPVLMGITMFLQQRLTPTTMDPAQAKIMMFMPLIFSVFMLSLPSGLTLYIFISTLFGIGQQLFLMKSNPTQVVVAKT